MASTSFRDQMNSLGWSRRDQDIPVNTSQQSGLLSSIKSLNPFGDSGYVRLPTTESAGAPLPAPSRREEEEGWFARESTLFSLLFSLASSPDPSRPLQPAANPGDPSRRTCAARGRHVLGLHMNSYPLLPARILFPILEADQRFSCKSTVSRWDRLLVFGACNLGALACFVICFALFPVLSVRPRKFVIL